MSIPIPPLPKACMLNFDGVACLYDAHDLRARDQEIVRAVLEAAANVCDGQRSNWSIEGVGQVALENAETAIRALEFHHE